MVRFNGMVMVHIKLETLVDELQRRGFTRDIAERAVAALTAPDDSQTD